MWSQSLEIEKNEQQTQDKRKTRRPYSKGELNKLIDSVCHPLSKTNQGFILVDGLLHAKIEPNPSETVKKFIKYNLPKILEQISQNSKEETNKK